MAFWKIKTKDGHEVSELNGAKWKDTQNNISELLFVTNDNRFIFLPKNMESYQQAKTASADLSGGNAQIESRYVGFKLGNNIIRIRVNEKTNNISVEVESI